MAIVGAYLVWYGIFEIRLLQRNETVGKNGPVEAFQRWAERAQDWLSRVDALQIALVMGLVIAGVVLAALIRADRRARAAEAGPAIEP
jgi:hypothetical protein